MSDCKHEWHNGRNPRGIFECSKCGRVEAGDSMPPGTAAELSALREQLEAARAIDKEWLKANAPGGWIDDLRIERNDLARRLRETESPVCEWQEDGPDSDVWTSTCGSTWQFNDGGPIENHMKHCHGCGKVIVPVALEDSEQEPQP